MNKEKIRKKRKLGVFPFSNVILSMSFSLLIFGLTGWLHFQGYRLQDYLRNNVEIRVYLDKNISSSSIQLLEKEISSDPYVTKIDGKVQMQLITKKEAAQEFITDIGEDFVQFLGDNPLRDLLVIKIKPEYQSEDSLKVIKKKIEEMSKVFEVSYQADLITQINNNITKLSSVLLIFSLISLLVVIFLINNTIKLALYSQRFLIRSMQLVGATNSFIVRPFLVRSLLLGFISGFIALLILLGIEEYLNNLVDGFKELEKGNQKWFLYSSIPLVGIIISYLSTFISINRYLKLSLDELY